MSDILISIIVPTYNRANLLSKTLESLVSQELRNIEILVIDDGSTDETESICLKFTAAHPQLKYYKISNRERGAARNFGARIATGKYINFFDSDDIAYPIHCSIAADIICKQNEPEVFALSYDIKNQFGETTKTRVLKNDVSTFIASGNDLSCNGVFIRRDIALENPFSENRALSASEDYELWLRLSSQFKLMCYPKVSHAVVHHPAQSTLNFNPLPLIDRKMLMLDLAFKDEHVMAKFGSQRRIMKFAAYTYIALHIALTGKRKMLSLKYLIRGILTYPQGLLSKRFLAVIKHLLIS
jgi:glycosyltransferase involved in cell wall biosynthesis